MVKEDVNGEGAAVSDVNRCESLDYAFGEIDVPDNVGFSEIRVRRVICGMSPVLHLNEGAGEILNRAGKICDVAVLATLPCGSVLQGAVHTAPGAHIAMGAGAAHQHIGAAGSQAVKHGVISGAYGSAQVGFTGPAGADSVNQTPSGSDEVGITHDYTPVSLSA